MNSSSSYSPSLDSVSIISDLFYGGEFPAPSSSLRSLDLFLPSSNQIDRCRSETSHSSSNNSISYSSLPPLLVLVHGGLWVSRDKSQLHAAASTFASSGFAVASVNYRLSEEKQKFDLL